MELKKVLIVSNSSNYNTLSKFVGTIPEKYLSCERDWSVTVESCGLHLSLKNEICPKQKVTNPVNPRYF